VGRANADAGLSNFIYIWGEEWPELKSDIEAMIASKREACAKIAESMTIPGHAVVGPVVQSIAAVIRER
jgi:hypothetical protein